MCERIGDAELMAVTSGLQNLVIDFREYIDSNPMMAAGIVNAGRVLLELVDRRADEAAAARELLVQVPVPGTDAAKMLIANKMLRENNGKLKNQVSHLEHEIKAMMPSPSGSQTADEARKSGGSP